MINYVAGTLAARGENSIVIDHQGIGLEILVPDSLLDTMPAIGAEVKVYTYFHVKEDGMRLYGFASRQDRELYKQLITVSGIGPKGGLAIMSTLRSDDIRFAILSDDAKTIAMAPGIGPKTAQKLILELKDKIDMEASIAEALDHGEQKALAEGESNGAADTLIADTVNALTALGYSPTEAMRAVHSVDMPENPTVEQLLKLSLKNV